MEQNGHTDIIMEVHGNVKCCHGISWKCHHKTSRKYFMRNAIIGLHENVKCHQGISWKCKCHHRNEKISLRNIMKMCKFNMEFHIYLEKNFMEI